MSDLLKQIQRFEDRKANASIETLYANAQKLTARLQKELNHAQTVINTQELMIRTLVNKAGGVITITGAEMNHCNFNKNHTMSSLVTKDGLMLIEFSGHLAEEKKEENVIAELKD